MKTCSVEGCEGAYHGRGWCRSHYRRWKKHGDPMKGIRNLGASLPDRFAAFVEVAPSDECIVWPQESCFTSGYGLIRYQGKNLRAHRVSYEIHKGEIPPGMLVRHKCDNPPCVNPDHLEAGTHADNMRDKSDRNRAAVGERSGLSKLTEAQVLEIRELAKGHTHTSISLEYGVTSANIDAIVKRKTWRHI